MAGTTSWTNSTTKNAVVQFPHLRYPFDLWRHSWTIPAFSPRRCRVIADIVGCDPELNLWYLEEGLPCIFSIEVASRWQREGFSTAAMHTASIRCSCRCILAPRHRHKCTGTHRPFYVLRESPHATSYEQQAVAILSDCRLNRDHTSKIMVALSISPDSEALIRQYVRTAKPPLVEPPDLEMYTLALADLSILDAWQYTRTFNESDEMRSRLFKKILEWAVTRKSLLPLTACR